MKTEQELREKLKQCIEFQEIGWGSIYNHIRIEVIKWVLATTDGAGEGK
jgi:hypothetical protein